jgi:hypothetical protein
MEAFQEWPDALPPSAHPNLVMRTSQQAPGAQPSVTVSLWHRGPRARVNGVIAEFIREVGAPPTGRSDRVANFFEAEYAEYCEGLTRAQCAPVTVPGGQLPRVGLRRADDPGTEVPRNRGGGEPTERKQDRDGAHSAPRKR